MRLFSVLFRSCHSSETHGKKPVHDIQAALGRKGCIRIQQKSCLCRQPVRWIVDTEIGGFAGNAPPGVDPTVRSVTDLEEAHASTNFHLRTPTDLPEGYALREVKLAPMGGTHWAFLFYDGPGHDIIVVQMSVGPQPGDEPNTVAESVVGLVTNGTLEEVDFDGRPAAWMDSHGLMWEADGVSYTVGGLDLSLEETLQIARSLR